MRPGACEQGASNSTVITGTMRSISCGTPWTVEWSIAGQCDGSAIELPSLASMVQPQRGLRLANERRTAPHRRDAPCHRLAWPLRSVRTHRRRSVPSPLGVHGSRRELWVADMLAAHQLNPLTRDRWRRLWIEAQLQGVIGHVLTEPRRCTAVVVLQALSSPRAPRTAMMRRRFMTNLPCRKVSEPNAPFTSRCPPMQRQTMFGTRCAHVAGDTRPE